MWARHLSPLTVVAAHTHMNACRRIYSTAGAVSLTYFAATLLDVRQCRCSRCDHSRLGFFFVITKVQPHCTYCMTRQKLCVSVSQSAGTAALRRQKRHPIGTAAAPARRTVARPVTGYVHNGGYSEMHMSRVFKGAVKHIRSKATALYHILRACADLILNAAFIACVRV
jgi:hypothetical protein